MAAIVWMALVGSVSAQTPNPWRISACPEAPMPRPAVHGELRVGLQLGGPQLVEVQYELRIDGSPEPAPMPHCQSINTGKHLVHDGPMPLAFDWACPATHADHDVVWFSPALRCEPLQRATMPPAMRLVWQWTSDGPVPRVERVVREMNVCPDGHCGQEIVIRPAGSIDQMVAHSNSIWQYHLPSMPCAQRSGGWWLDATPVPQPRHAIRTITLAASYDPLTSPALRLPAPALACAAPAHDHCDIVVGVPGMTQPLACCAAHKPLGTWYREVEGMMAAVTLRGSEMTLCLTQYADNSPLRITISADCTITTDGLSHGVITGVDVEAIADGRSTAADEAAKMQSELQTLIDSPFAFRLKPTTGGIMVTNLQLAGISKKEMAIGCGMYKLAPAGKVPASQPVQRSAVPARCEPSWCTKSVSSQPLPDAVPVMPLPAPPGAVIPAPRCEVAPPDVMRHVVIMSDTPGIPSSHVVVPCDPFLQCPPQYFTPTPAAAPVCRDLLPPVALPQAGWCPAQPANVPPGDFGMMAEVFGQMLSAPPCIVQPAALGSLPPRPLTVPPMPVPAAQQLAGTWVREVGPFVYILKLTSDQITITARAATELDSGKMAIDGMILTAEYHLARDGITAVGLVTGVDARLEGELDGADMNSLQDELAKFQKALTDKPFAMSLRRHGDSLVIGNVRLPEVLATNGPTPLTALGGCYSSLGDKPIPKLKPVKAGPMPPYQAPCVPPFVGGPGLPPPPLSTPMRGPSPSPYVAAPPSAAQSPIVISGPGLAPPPEVTDRIPPPSPRVSEVPPSPMPSPIPPAVDTPKEKKKGKKKKDASAELPPLPVAR